MLTGGALNLCSNGQVVRMGGGGGGGGMCVFGAGVPEQVHFTEIASHESGVNGYRL